MNILEGLNKPQQDAVKTLSGPLLILAGAGSGKTRTLTHRIANLIAHGVPSANILAVTFTNKAAKEMRVRLWRLLAATQGEMVGVDTDADGIMDPPRAFMPYMGTFHSICVKILRIEHETAGLDASFTIYDTDDQLALIRQAIKELNLADKKALKPRSVQRVISNCKNAGQTPEDYRSIARYPVHEYTAQVFERYEKLKNDSLALDFDDLILKTVELFDYHPEVREKWQKKFQHILVDEYQDTNHMQYRFIRALVGMDRNICVVGDDWQSIYSWRGADFTNILNFEKDFKGAKVIKLEQNYRSTDSILQTAQKVITNNELRTEKFLYTKAGKGEPVDIKALSSEMDEAEYVAQIISQKNFDFREVAVLYRTNAQSYVFEKKFIEYQIPYKLVGGVRFYDRAEVKDVLALVKVISNPNDRVSLDRFCRNVLSGIGPSSLEKLHQFLGEHQDAMKALTSSAVLELLQARGRVPFRTLQEFLGSSAVQLPPAELVAEIVERFEFKSILDDKSPDAEDRLENLNILAENAAAFDNIDDFLAEAALMSSADEAVTKNSVTLMTIHSAKGLEFPEVFIVGLEEGLMPSYRAIEEGNVEEERRLMYVGMTRAKEKLYLTYAKSRFSNGQRSYGEPSRFLTEIGYKAYGSYGSTDGSDFGTDKYDGVDECYW